MIVNWKSNVNWNLYVNGKVVIGDSHLMAYEKLTPEEKAGELSTGFFNKQTRLNDWC